MTKTETKIQGVYLIDPVLHGDPRGFFMEVWNQQTFASLGIDEMFVQDNHSRSVKGTLRGLHYQIQCPQGKLVRVIAGEVYDVAVDLRRQSPTFGQWVGALLSSENRRMMWVPPGMAHGFYVTSDIAELLYKCTDFYKPEHERSLRWNDPELGIKWPLQPDVDPLLSAKDINADPLKNADHFD